MAIPTNLFSTYDAIGNREDLADVIFNIDPTETPIVSAAGRGTVNAVLADWQTDNLAAPDATNEHEEGFDLTVNDIAASTPTVRVGNYTQISRRSAIVSGTQEAVNKAGRRSEIAYQMIKRGLELRRDLEAMVTANQGGAAGAETLGSPRIAAKLGAWVKTNTNFGTGGADPVYTSGVPGAGRTDGTQRPFTEAIFKDVVQQMFDSGARISRVTVYAGPFNKQVMSGFAGVVQRNFDMSNTSPRPTAVIAAVEVYVSDFGNLRLAPDRFQRERDAWFIDPQFLSLPTLPGRSMMSKRLGPTLDGEARAIIHEWTLKVDNEAALGLAADLTVSP